MQINNLAPHVAQDTCASQSSEFFPTEPSGMFLMNMVKGSMRIFLKWNRITKGGGTPA